ncbi:MAG: hypothetical protein EHM18_00330 [Acidobacteria bacterium]|nr:MAG: hypothetical protein EHM18_00330 [Acidobacteriota bacterium]
MSFDPLTVKIIGLTGPLSSGCSTIAGYLTESHDYRLIRLSDFLRESFDSGYPASGSELQKRGNEWRRDRGLDVLATIAIQKFAAETGPPLLVIDGIRNQGEVAYLRSYPQFYLVAVDAPFHVRLERERTKGHAITDLEFRELDQRDSGVNEEAYGQHVSWCTDLADFQILNNESWENHLDIKEAFLDKVELFLRLVNDRGVKRPTLHEAGMHHAYSASLLSPCLKRRVGAVVVRRVEKPSGNYEELVLAVGFNRPPIGERSCQERWGKCFRDKMTEEKEGRMDQYIRRLKPNVGEGELREIHKLMASKQLDYCRSLHAEESAILQVAQLGGVSLDGTTLYTTTFPCLLCAKKIVQAGIRKVVYNEPYPVKEASEVLEKQCELIRFEGVKSVAYFRLFGKNISF